MRLFNLIRCGGLLLGLALASLAQAATVDGLYEVRVPVASQAEAEREFALTHAMAAVLVRVTGSRQIAASPVGAKLIGLAGRFLRQYRYEPLPVGKAYDGIEPVPTQLLYAQFDESAINEAIWREKLAVWGKTRPAMLVWLAAQEPERRVLVENRDDSVFAQAIREQARNRGVPVAMPALDAQDLANLPVDDVWNEAVEQIRRASARYPAEVILAGHVAQAEDGSWVSRWLFLLADELKTWDLQGPDANALVVSAIDAAADEIAVRYAPTAGNGEASDVVVRVANVRSVDDYARTQRYLAALPGVSAVQVLRVDPASVVLRISLRAGKSAFEQAVVLGGLLGPDAFDPSRDAATNLVYRLLP